MDKNAGKAKGFIMTIAGGLCWAVGGICGQTLFTGYGVVANWLVPYRLTSAGLILLLISALSGKKIFTVWQRRANLPPLVVFALLGSAMCQYGYYSSIQYSNAALATVLSYTSPVFILLWGILRTRCRPKLYEVLSVLLVFGGALACATHFQWGGLVVNPLALVFGTLSAVCFAFYSISPRKLIAEYGVLCITGWGMVLGGLALLCVFHPWTIPGEQYCGTFFLLFSVVVLVGTVASFALFQAGCSIVGPLAGSVLSSVEPVGSVILSVLFLHASFTWQDLLGFAMILSTIPILSFCGAQKDKEKSA